MNEEERNSREQLLAAQAQDPRLKMTYQEEMRAMLERKVPAAMRWMLAFYAAVLLLGAVVTALALARMTADDPGLKLCVPGLMLALVMAGGLGWLAWRGRPLRAIHGLFGALMGGCFSPTPVSKAGLPETISRTRVPSSPSSHRTTRPEPS